MIEARTWQKITNQRTAVLEYLQTSTEHPKAQKIYQEVKKQLPRISLSTIYRILEELIKQNLVREVLVKRQEVRYETNFQDHINFYCRLCRRIIDIPMTELLDIKRRLKAKNYIVEENNIVIQGVCPVCWRLKQH